MGIEAMQAFYKGFYLRSSYEYAYALYLDYSPIYEKSMQ